MNPFLYSINATLPIFLIILLGKILQKMGILTEGFTKSADSFVFYVALPVLLFQDLTVVSPGKGMNISFLFFCFFATLIFILVVWVGTELLMKKEEEKGAFIQASYRSSAALLGMAFIHNMYGNAGSSSFMILGAVPLFNIFAVIILTLKGKGDETPNIKGTLKQIATNPILIAIVLGLIFSFLPFHLPVFAQKGLTMIGNTATPLALLSIGASFQGTAAIQKIKPTLLATFIKLVGISAVCMPIAILLGFRNQELVATLIMCASPTTVSSYIMAAKTNNDKVLTASTIVLTTLLSSVTLTLWIFFLKTQNFI